MKVGVFQFRAGDSISANHKAIIRGIDAAFENKVRLLVFQECAACGYPPVETPSTDNIDFDLLDTYLQEIRGLAKKYDMYIALGTITKQDSMHYNSLQLSGIFQGTI